MRAALAEPRPLGPIICAALAVGCAEPASPSPNCASSATGDGTCGDGVAYLRDRGHRRAELERSLVSKTNDYALRRLAHYATGAKDDWEKLPEWNPLVSPVRISDFGASAAYRLDDATPLVITDAARAGSREALIALGRAAFARFPAQAVSSAEYALLSPDLAARYGFWTSEASGVGGLVRAEMADGSASLEMTCSTCHARPSGADVEPGRPNVDLDLGRLMADTEGAEPSGMGAALRGWGPGRLDVSTSTGLEPVKIPDLRPVRWVPYLQVDATVRKGDLDALAIRIETLIIVSQNEVVRPPREVALGLATYLISLGTDLPPWLPESSDELRGADAFDTVCATCHVPPEYAGPPVTIESIGTDPTVGRSADRGTGMYRVPSLRGVSTRGPLLHDGSLRDLDSMFDPARLDAHYSGGRLAPGPVRGHSYALDWSAGDREALLAFMRTL
jgi:hypothetical protein